MSDDAYDGGGQSRRSSRRRSPGRRRRGRLTLLLGVIVVLAVIAVVGDRIAVSYADKELRAHLVSGLKQKGVSYDSLDVGISGFPFLTQVARGNYDQITIDLAGVQLPERGSRAVSLPSLHVVASGVDADTQQVIEGTAKVNAKQVTGTAVVSFRTLDTLVDYSAYRLSEVTYSESNGGLRVSGKTTLSGVVVPVEATAEIAVVDGKFRVKLRDLTAVNLPAPALVRDYLSNLAQESLTAQLPALPFGLTLDAVTVRATGLAVTATGHDVPLLN